MATRELEAEHVRWLWQGRLAFGKLTSMVGQEDRRKSFLCATIAATTNTGGEWPGGGRSEPGHVVYLQAEDGFHDTTLPRLQAAGAKVTNEPVRSAGMEPQRAPRRLFRPDQFRPSRIRVRLFLHQPTYFTIVPPRPQAQSLIAALNELEQDYLTIPNLRLFIIDPFNAFSEGQTTHHMAGALRRLQHIAEKYDVAVLLVHHFHKQLQRTVREMIYGSSMVRSISRITLAVQADPDNRRNSILTGDKCNIAREAEGLVYGIRDSEATFRGGEKKPFPTVEWLGTDDRTADELAAELFDNVKVAGKQSKQRRVDMWTEFLAERIHPGDKMRVTEIEEKAREAKLLRPKSALKDCRPADHAVMDLGIEKISESDGNGGRAVSWWVRPRDDDERVHGDGVGGTQH